MSADNRRRTPRYSCAHHRDSGKCLLGAPTKHESLEMGCSAAVNNAAIVIGPTGGGISCLHRDRLTARLARFRGRDD